MPGLSQLKQFNNDLISLGDEITVRASRGEKPVKIPIPKDIEDVNDSEDFVLGMPEIEQEVEAFPVDEDLSDLTGLGGPSESKSDKSEDAAPSFATPDLSSLLNPVVPEGGGDDGMPDLSMFADEPEEVEEEPEPEEPEEVSIADMGLDALLGGFDGNDSSDKNDSQQSESSDDEFFYDLSKPEPKKESSDAGSADLGTLGNIEDFGIGDIEDIDSVEELDELGDVEELDSGDALAGDAGVDAGDAALDTAGLGLDSTPTEDALAGGAGFDLDTAGLGLDNAEADLDNPELGLDNAELGLDMAPATEESSAAAGTEVSDDFLSTLGLDDIGLDNSAVEPANGEVSVGTENAAGAVDADFDLGNLDGGLGDIEGASLESGAAPLEEPLPADVAAETTPAADIGLETADAGLDDLGGGLGDLGGFDLGNIGGDAGLESTEPGLESGTAPLEEPSPADVAAETTPAADIGLESADAGLESPDADFDLGSLDGGFGDIDGANLESPVADAGLDDLGGGLGDLGGLESAGDGFETSDAGLENPAPADAGETFGLDDLGGGLDDLGGFDLPDDLDSSDGADAETSEPLAPMEDVPADTGLESVADNGLESPAGLDEVASGTGLEAATPDNLFDMGDLDAGGLADLGTDSAEPEKSSLDSELESIGINLDTPDSGSTENDNFIFNDIATTEDPELAAMGDNEESSSSRDSLDIPDDFEVPSKASDSGADAFADGAADLEEVTDFGSFDLDDMDGGSAAPDFNGEIPDYEDANIAGSGDDAGSIEEFDTSAMDGLDFNIPDTDSQMGDGGFDLGNSDDFAMEGEFEIPGFSDVDTVKEEKKAKAVTSKSKEKSPKAKKVSENDEDYDAEEGMELPPNTLTDKQYKTFLKNLNEYPLNVRLAVEDLIVQDEFTDDAEFEVIEKILNKVPARQVASMLEKMLDTSIPVPRDYEHRTAEEYEAYKKSLAYQLKNKIIPAALVGLVMILVGWGLFNFGKNCIYKPLKANSLYKQGYALLEADEYPQSEMKFDTAVKYRLSKKWFFRYARGYREHKQFQRAARMYDNILKCFRHDKAAGLEYADMEMDDMANYERAEEIVRRQVLDYHINDKDGILKLGDIFLEWGTEKDPAKLEDARAQYATLIQLYGSNDLYLSRMMRYFIRSDNLREVLQLQPTFEPREKSLCAEDWAELSGYLMDKYYGALAPSEEYLRNQIEGLRGLLLRAVKADPGNPIAQYNLAKYFINSNEDGAIEQTLQSAIEKFNKAPSMKKRDVYKYIDSYRLLGEYYTDHTDYLKAQEQYAEGISLFATERDNAGFEGTPDVGKLYKDMGDIKYSVSGDYEEALNNYKYSVELGNDSPGIRYRIGYIQYNNNNYMEALGAFMKAGDGNIKERNLMLAMANTLALRGDDYAAEGYYNQLIDSLDRLMTEREMVFPQTNIKDYDIVNTYLSAANNYGVTLYKLAKRTGNSSLNAKAIVELSQSVRAWDALTRNQDTLVKLGGSNLAEQNIKYITNPIPDFEPAIYTEIHKTLLDNEKL